MSTSSKDNRIDALRSAAGTQELSLLSRLWRVICHPQRIPMIMKRRIFASRKIIDWNSRAQELGAYSVIDSRHSPEEYAYVTKRQKEIIYPYFRATLNGKERSVLDFGCGVGRFTADLAEMISGEAVGTDITKKLIEICPPHKNVRYVQSENFFGECNLKFDVIWVSLVLGGVPDAELSVLAKKLEDALARNGLLFLVESTGEENLEDYWRIRSEAQLRSLFPSVCLQHVGSYYDVNQEISILAGRKE